MILPGNTTFFAKATKQNITWGDIFSDVFKHHTKEDSERLFMAGTTLTTPNESQMLSEWRKPWLFARVGIFGLVFIVIMNALSTYGGELYAKIPLVFIGAIITPVSVLLFMWEMNIPRNIPIYLVLGMFFTGGGLSLIFTFIMHSFVGDTPPYLAPITEEPAKLLALCLFIYKSKYKYGLNGLLIGAATGAGFAAFETMGYAIREGINLQVLLNRSLLAPGGHVLWAALYGGALALAKGSDKLEWKHFKDNRFIFSFLIACVLHFVWNYPFVIVRVPFFGDLKYVILILVGWIALLWIVKLGTLQVVRMPQAWDIPSSGAQTISPSPKAVSLRCVSGAHSGGVFSLSGNSLVFGRNSKRANIIFPSSAPGISSVHCDIEMQNGCVILTDRNSSYGTFLSDGTRLTPGKPYTLRPQQGFYLANRKNMFVIE
jgi:RsiW-degrading membrane proteinase PrsW (M82 family)